MIHCFQGCEQACKECEPLCRAIDRPLGGYVLLATVLNVPAALLATIGVLSAEVRACNNLSLLCIADAALGVGHTVFAFYLQRRLTLGLDNPGLASGSQQTPSSRELMKSAGQIVLYDVGFCIYVIVFAAAFFLNLIGFSWISACRANTSLPWLAAMLETLFAFGAIVFAILWSWALACDDGCGGGLFGMASSSQGQPNRGLLRFVLGTGASQSGPRAGAAPTVMGAPMPGGGQAYRQQTDPVAPPAAQAAAAPGGQPTAAQQATSQAKHAAATGLQMAGKGLQAVGSKVSGGRK